MSDFFPNPFVHTLHELKKFPTVLKVYDCHDSRDIPPGHLVIFVDGPELNDLILDWLHVGTTAEFINWSFRPEEAWIQ